jgi:hypothetical protein
MLQVLPSLNYLLLLEHRHRQIETKEEAAAADAMKIP